MDYLDRYKSFKINEIEVSEDFNLDFNKKKVFDKAFESAFFQLISTVVLSKDIEKSPGPTPLIPTVSWAGPRI